MSSYPPSSSSNTFNSNDFSSLNTSKSVLSQQQANNLYLKKSGDTASGTMIFSSGTQQRNTDAILFSDDSSSLTTKLNAKQNTITSATNLSVNNLTTSGTLTTNSNINMNGNIIANSQTITPINVSYLSGTTNSVQNQINNKQDILTSSTNISVNNIGCSLVVANVSSNLNF